MSQQKAVGEVKRNYGTQFDPAVVDIFMRRIDEIENIGNWNGDRQHV
jgi:response regulator RpfG family c-di-GMP phosphodiesterase